MSLERKDRGEPAGLRELWEITKPEDPQHSRLYLELLKETVRIPKQYRFRQSFQRPKKSGGARTITPAAEPLRTTHVYLSHWIRNNLPQGQDYCYTGRRVEEALGVHRASNYALVCDLKDAFDQVTEVKIKNWFSLYDSRLRGEPLNLMVDLLTYRGRAPQGCRPTAFTYNTVVAEMDRHLELIAPKSGAEKMTRYSDNICFSSKEKINFHQLEDQEKESQKVLVFN